jgi:hypothetical protein
MYYQPEGFKRKSAYGVACNRPIVEHANSASILATSTPYSSIINVLTNSMLQMTLNYLSWYSVNCEAELALSYCHVRLSQMDPEWAPGEILSPASPTQTLANHCSPALHLGLILAHLKSLNTAGIAALVAFPNRSGFRSGLGFGDGNYLMKSRLGISPPGQSESNCPEPGSYLIYVISAYAPTLKHTFSGNSTFSITAIYPNCLKKGYSISCQTNPRSLCWT